MWRRKGTLWLLSLLVLVCLLLPGCFTSALWGRDLDDTSLTSEKTYEHKEHVPLWVKVFCTPLALFLDLLTSPIQDCLSDEDDEHDDNHCHHRERRHRNRCR